MEMTNVLVVFFKAVYRISTEIRKNVDSSWLNQWLLGVVWDVAVMSTYNVMKMESIPLLEC